MVIVLTSCLDGKCAPDGVGRERCFDVNGCFRYGMDEIDGMGTEADASIGIAALGTVLEVAANG